MPLRCCIRRPAQGLLPTLSSRRSRTAAAPHGPDAAGYKAHNPVSLAFLGDSIWTLYVRAQAFPPPRKFGAYHAAATQHVSAESQALLYGALRASQQLLPVEREILNWAYGAANVGFRGRFGGTAAGRDVYRRATAFEALLGYLQLDDPDRLEDVLLMAKELLEDGAATGEAAAITSSASSNGNKQLPPPPPSQQQRRRPSPAAGRRRRQQQPLPNQQQPNDRPADTDE